MAQFTFSVDDSPMPEYDSVDAPQEEEDSTRYLVIAYFLVLLIAVGAAVLFLVQEMAFEKSTERTQDVDKDAVDSVPLGPLFIPRPSDTTTLQTGTTKSTVRTSETTTAEHITTRTRTTMISKPTTTSTANTKTTEPATTSTRSIMTTEHTTTSTRSTMTTKQTTTSTGTSTTAEHTTKSTRSTLTAMRTTTSTPSTITTVGTKTSTKSTITTEPTTTSTANTLATEPTTTSTRSTSATEQTTTSTSGTTTTVMTTTTPPSFPPGALICTVSRGFTRATFQFPPDGLCTIVFFDSLDDRRPEQLSPSYQEDFLYFQQTAREHTRTMYGVGFNHRVLFVVTAGSCMLYELIIIPRRHRVRRSVNDARETLLCVSVTKVISRNTFELAQMPGVVQESGAKEELKRPEAKAHLENLWKSNIRHYGHVNFPLYFANPTTLSSVLHNLKAVSELLHSKKSSGSPMYTALRVFPRVRGYLPAVFRTVFMPDLLIVQASFDPEAFRSIVPCVITPPLALALSPGASTYYTMSSAIDEMKFLGKEKFRSGFALALALYGYAFKPAYPDLEETKPGNYSVMHKCSGFPASQNMVKVCRNLTFTPFIYDSAHDADFAYSKKMQTTFVYDSIAALSAKLCETKKKILELPYAFAAYGLEYEDSKNACGLGAFARLHYLRKLQEFFHHNYTSEQDAEACKTIR